MKHPLVSKKKSWFRSPWMAIVLLVCVVWGIFSTIGAYRKDQEAVGLRDQSARQLADLDEKQSELNTEITNFSSTRGIEAEIRNRYRVERPGENLIIVVDNSADAAQIPKPTLFQKIRAYIGW